MYSSTVRDLKSFKDPAGNLVNCDAVDDYFRFYEDDDVVTGEELARIILEDHIVNHNKADIIWKYNKYVFKVTPESIGDASYDKILRYLGVDTLDNMYKVTNSSESTNVVKCDHIKNVHYSLGITYGRNVLLSTRIDNARNYVFNRPVSYEEFKSAKDILLDDSISIEDRLSKIFDPDSYEYTNSLRLIRWIDRCISLVNNIKDEDNLL